MSKLWLWPPRHILLIGKTDKRKLKSQHGAPHSTNPAVKDTMMFSQVLSKVCGADCILVSFDNSLFETNITEHLIFTNSLSRLIDSVSKILPDKTLSFSILIRFHMQIGEPATMCFYIKVAETFVGPVQFV